MWEAAYLKLKSKILFCIILVINSKDLNNNRCYQWYVKFNSYHLWNTTTHPHYHRLICNISEVLTATPWWLIWRYQCSVTTGPLGIDTQQSTGFCKLASVHPWAVTSTELSLLDKHCAMDFTQPISSNRHNNLLSRYYFILQMSKLRLRDIK